MVLVLPDNNLAHISVKLCLLRAIGEVFLTNKEKVLSGSIGPLRGNEEALGTSAFEIYLAMRMPAFSLAFEAKRGELFETSQYRHITCANM